MGKSVSDRCNATAYVILNRKGEHVANVQFLFGSGGGVQCDVINFGNASGRCLVSALKANRVSMKHVEKLESEAKYCSTPEDRRDYAARELFHDQTGRAGGYGYDKKAAALSGLMIDGHTMADHCGNVPEAEAQRARLFREYCKAHDIRGGNTDPEYWRKRAAKIGCRFANWQEGGDTRWGSPPPRIGRYTSLHFDSGLDRLQALGYRVINAI
jgi:hypothetical protein